MLIIKVQLIVETKAIITNVNVVVVNVITIGKTIGKHVFKDRESKKAKMFLTGRKEND